MKKICILGKGGIGKSTVTSNLAAALGKAGFKVLLIGCDPKADSTRNLTKKRIPSVFELYERDRKKIGASDILFAGFGGVHCVEVGGPGPGEGRTGEETIAAIRRMNELGIPADGNYDVILYDVPGDGSYREFDLLLKEEFAGEIEVYILTSCEFMSLYAANNICRYMERAARKGKLQLGGIIHNGRSVVDSRSIITDFAAALGTKVIGYVPMDISITMAELNRSTVVEYAPQDYVADYFKALARDIWEQGGGGIPAALSEEALEEFSIKIDHVLHIKTFR